MESPKSNSSDGYQNIFVIRHGDRIDHFDPLWVSTAERPWDPPLIQDGMDRAFQTGQRIRSQIKFPIHRVFVSPLIRCIQTASQVVAALSAVNIDPNATSTLKVAIEFGLCNSVTRRPRRAPVDGKFDFNISELEAMFPEEMIDHNFDMVYKQVPQLGDSWEAISNRFVTTLSVLADKYPSENLVLITHWGGIGAILYKYLKEAREREYRLDYCASVELRRQILNNDDVIDKPDEFEVVTTHGLSFKTPKP